MFFADALPVVFSWPVLPSTVKPDNFLLTLNTGAQVQPEVVSISPNLEYNERNTVVLFGEFGNRLAPSDPDAVYVTHVTVVEGTTPMQLYEDGDGNEHWLLLLGGLALFAVRRRGVSS